MVELSDSALNAQVVTTLLAAVAVTATILTIAMPLFSWTFDRRMEPSRSNVRKSASGNGKKWPAGKSEGQTRQTPKQYMQTIVENSTCPSGSDRKKRATKLIQAGYRGQATLCRHYLFVPHGHSRIALLAVTAFYRFHRSQFRQADLRSSLASVLWRLISACKCRISS